MKKNKKNSQETLVAYEVVWQRDGVERTREFASPLSARRYANKLLRNKRKVIGVNELEIVVG